MEEKIKCLATEKVKYTQRVDYIMQLPVPMDTALNKGRLLPARPACGRAVRPGRGARTHKQNPRVPCSPSWESKAGLSQGGRSTLSYQLFAGAKGEISRAWVMWVWSRGQLTSSRPQGGLARQKGGQEAVASEELTHQFCQQRSFSSMRRRSGRPRRRNCHCQSWSVPRYPSAPAWRPTGPLSRWTTSGAQPCRPNP